MTEAPKRRHRLSYPQVDGEKLWQRRRARGMFLKELSEKSGNSVSFLSDVERGRRNARPERVERIAEALGCTPADLLLSRPA